MSDEQPKPMIPKETAILLLRRVQLGAQVVLAAAQWAEMPASMRRRGELFTAIEELSDLVGLP